MSMAGLSPEQLVDLSERVRRGLGVRSGQSIFARALEIAELAIIQEKHVPEKQQRAAAIVLGDDGDPWDRMSRAADALAPEGVSQVDMLAQAEVVIMCLEPSDPVVVD